MQEIREQNFQTYNDTSSVNICKFHHEFQAKEVPLHSHEEYCELVYLQKGRAALNIGGQSIQAQSGALIFLEKAVTHEGSYQALERCGKTERYVLKIKKYGPAAAAGISSGDQPRYSPHPDLPVPADRTRVPVTRSGLGTHLYKHVGNTVSAHPPKCPARTEHPGIQHAGPAAGG